MYGATGFTRFYTPTTAATAGWTMRCERIRTYSSTKFVSLSRALAGMVGTPADHRFLIKAHTSSFTSGSIFCASNATRAPIVCRNGRVCVWLNVFCTFQHRNNATLRRPVRQAHAPKWISSGAHNKHPVRYGINTNTLQSITFAD